MQTLLLLAMLASANAVVNRPVADMYSGPSEDKDVVSQAQFGANVEIIAAEGEWREIRTADDYRGWVPAAALVTTPRKYGAAARVAEVASLFAHLYREPNVTRHRPLLTVPFETRLEVVAEPEENERRWLQVRLPDDRPAWVQRGDITLKSGRATVPEMIDLARRFLGLPYTWGGTTSFGYDCSGFTQMLCRRRGILMPRDADDQAAWSGLTPVTTSSELRPGDLLFFGPRPEKIDHTGLYIGDGQFIHATTRGKPMVQISRLEDWTRSLVAMRRPK